MKTYTLYYTNAPTDYDYHYAREVDNDIGVVDKRDRPVRIVAINDECAEAQRNRYGSGLFLSLATKDALEEVAYKHGLIRSVPRGDL